MEYEPIPIDPAARTVLEAGRLRMVFTEGRLQWVSLGEVELMRRIYFAHRDPSWVTVPFAIEAISLRQARNAFVLSYDAVTRSPTGDFRFTCTIDGGTDDSLDVHVRGEALTELETNRIGLCAHYPHELAGTPLRSWSATDPTQVLGAFPENIEPYQPLVGLGGIAHPVGDGLWCHAEFRGDLFEMEDQRNFSDASYKVYSTPADDPIPRRRPAGATVEQRMSLRLVGTDALGPAFADSGSSSREPMRRVLAAGEPSPVPRPPVRFAGAAMLSAREIYAELSDGAGIEIGGDLSGGNGVEIDVEIGDAKVGLVPAIGTDVSRWCAVAVDDPAVGPSGRPLDEAVRLVRALGLGHLRLELDLENPDWLRRLSRGVDLADRSGAQLDLVISADGDELPPRLFERVAQAGGAVGTIAAVARAEPRVTTRALAQAVREGLARSGSSDGALPGPHAGISAGTRADHAGTVVPSGGGSAGWFIELNRAELALEDMDFLTYGLTPQVHAFDDDAIRENLYGQPPQVSTARKLARGRPVRVGPVSFRPRQPVLGSDASGAPFPESLRDVRLDTPFGAVWTFGSIAMHAAAGTAALTLYELFGPEAIGGDVSPIGEVLRRFASLSGREVLASSSSSPLQCVPLVIRSGGHVHCYLGNLGPDAIRVRVSLPSGVRSLGPSVRGRGPDGEPSGPSIETVEIAGYEVMRLTGPEAGNV